jgi:GNAT superfamily N-acetyltransferase
MTPSPERLVVKCQICGPADEDEIVHLLGAVFSQRDPPAVAMGLTLAEFEALVRLFSSRVAAGGLTFIARRADTGAMIGALLTEDSASPLPAGMDRLSPKFNPIFDILGQLTNEYLAGKAMPSGEMLHLFLLGVDQGSTGNGVAQQLVTACLENGRRKGYRLAVTEATNRISRHIFLKQGFVERVWRSYRDHRYEGQAAFLSIADQGGPVLMDKVLT